VNQPGHRQSYQQAPPALRKDTCASWASRVLAAVIDGIAPVVVILIGLGVEMGTRQTLCAPTTTEYDVATFCSTGNTTVGLIVFLASLVIALLFLLWNYGYRQGTTGSSLGKSVVNVKVVDENSRRPIGFGKSVLRQLAHLLDAAICYVGFLFPLWDAKRQTLADKLLKTVCLPTR
jgi:uncharacterized RDD family membrane protein YckC